MLSVSVPFVNTPPHPLEYTPVVAGFFASAYSLYYLQLSALFGCFFFSIYNQELNYVLKQIVYGWGPDHLTVDLNRLNYL
jgi:hypothetical protein